MTQAAVQRSSSSSSTSSRKPGGAASGSAGTGVQMKESLRGQDFAAQESMLRPIQKKALPGPVQLKPVQMDEGETCEPNAAESPAGQAASDEGQSSVPDSGGSSQMPEQSSEPAPAPAEDGGGQSSAEPQASGGDDGQTCEPNAADSPASQTTSDENQTCEPDPGGGSSAGPAPEEKKDEGDSSVGVEFPIRRELPGGIEIGGKIGSEGGEIFAGAKANPKFQVPLGVPWLFGEADIEFKGGVTGKAGEGKWSVSGGWGVEARFTINGGVAKVASIYAGAKFSAALQSTINGTYNFDTRDVGVSGGGIGGSLSGAIVIGAKVDLWDARVEYALGGDFELLQISWTTQNGFSAGKGKDVDKLIAKLEALKDGDTSGWSEKNREAKAGEGGAEGAPGAYDENPNAGAGGAPEN